MFFVNTLAPIRLTPRPFTADVIAGANAYKVFNPTIRRHKALRVLSRVNLGRRPTLRSRIRR
jgi:hypothetical protein